MKKHCLFGVSAFLPSFFVVLVLVAVSREAASAPLVKPFESDTAFVPVNEIDRLVLSNLAAAGLQPANLCSDEVFIRRIYLDMTGTLPNTAAVLSFS